MYKSLNTITTIELSSYCNFNCSYCIQPAFKRYEGRKPGFMTEEVFAASLRLLERIVPRGTQREIHVSGNGEATLHPKIIEYTARVREVMGPDAYVGISTNGSTMTSELAAGLRNAGISRIDISPHSVKHAQRAGQVIMQAGLPVLLNTGSIATPHDWCGQVDLGFPMAYINMCDALLEGRGYIQSDGHISPCCFDYRHLGSFGTVFDADILERKVKAFELCETCHQMIPEEVLDGEETVRQVRRPVADCVDGVPVVRGEK